MPNLHCTELHLALLRRVPSIQDTRLVKKRAGIAAVGPVPHISGLPVLPLKAIESLIRALFSQILTKQTGCCERAKQQIKVDHTRQCTICLYVGSRLRTVRILKSQNKTMH